jgi:hypothetical protein
MYRRPYRAMAMPVLCAAVAVIGLVAVPAADAAVHPAQTGPAARFASEATAHQNKIIESALARAPGGTRISASEVKWPDGTVLGVPASSDQDSLNTCLDSLPELVFCGFTQVNYYGSWLASAQVGSDVWVPWGNIFVDQGMYSWYNQTDTRVWREQFQDHGNELCIDPWPYGNFTESSYTGPDVFDYWNLMTSVEAQC